MSAQARADREAVRFQAAALFDEGADTAAIAQQLRVTRKSVNSWRRAWREGGITALASKGPGGANCRLDEEQLTILEKELDAGPAAHGWDTDQRWTLARAATLVFELFRIRYTPRGMSYLLHRIGWTPQVPAHRGANRDDEAIATWVRETWPDIKGRRWPGTHGSASRKKPART
jgi:transposase